MVSCFNVEGPGAPGRAGCGARGAQDLSVRDRFFHPMTRLHRAVDQDALKKLAGEEAAKDVEDGMVVGLGTGSTVRYTILELARRVKDEDLDILGIPTSKASADLAREGGIGLTDLDHHPVVDLTIDGADEFDPHLDLIKGGGGALTREKVVAKASKKMTVVADASKGVEHLGSTFALPIEVLDFAKTPVLRLCEELGAEPHFRRDGHDLFRTDNGHCIIDAKWPRIEDPQKLERTLNGYPGVLDCGLFLGLCTAVVVAEEGGDLRRLGR